MIQLDNERMTKSSTNSLLVFNDIFLLIITDKSLQHHLHRVELPIPQTTYQVDLAETTYRQAFTDLVSFKSPLACKFQAVETSLTCKDTLADRDLVVQKKVLLNGLKCNHLCSFEKRVFLTQV